MKILVCGLPGSGKTTFARELTAALRQQGAVHYDGDEVREALGDWGFTKDGRIEQALRMNWLASKVSAAGGTAICSFICPTEDTRQAFNADITVWMDTVRSSKFPDTDKMFTAPIDPEVVFKKFPMHDERRAFIALIYDLMSMRTDRGMPTTLLMGRFQPWHAGHRALFEKSLKKSPHGHVTIAVRQMEFGPENPYNYIAVRDMILNDLEGEFDGQFKVVKVPNFTHVHYGRKVGYEIKKLKLPKKIKDISATTIRRLFGSK